MRCAIPNDVRPVRAVPRPGLVRALGALSLPAALLSTLASAQGGSPADLGAMLRDPDVSATHVVFVYAGDLWLVPREGGVASPLASPEGPERDPCFSPDGSQVAFGGNYDGNLDLYVVDVAGGLPRRVTHHPATELLSDWTADGRLVFSSNGSSGNRRAPRMYTVSPAGGLPVEVPVPYGQQGTFHADGRTLAYTPNSRDNRNWKRYVGGTATDLWLFDTQDGRSTRVTDWEGTDTAPMWHGDELIYQSDRGPDHRLNLWSYDRTSGEHVQLTGFVDADVKWPAIGPGDAGQGEVVFQSGANLWLLDLATRELRALEVTIPGARDNLRPRDVDVASQVSAADVAPKGERVVVEARGDLWTLPARHGAARNLTRTSGVAERDPAWSPDGRWIAYFSDASGEYELWLTQSDGLGETRQLTSGTEGYKYRPTWSPDGERIAFSDRTGSIFVHHLDAATTTFVARDEVAEWGSRVRWSPDGRWLCFSKVGAVAGTSSVFLYDAEADALQQVTSDMFSDSEPAFDRDGDWLYLASGRSFTQQVSSAIDNGYVHTDVEVLLALPLRADVQDPFAPKHDEVSWEDEEAGDGETADAASPKDAPDAGGTESAEDEDEPEEEETPVEIEFDGLEARAIQLPVRPGRFSDLAVDAEGRLLYVRHGEGGGVRLFDPGADEPEEQEVHAAGSFGLSADGKVLLLADGGKLHLAPAGPKAEAKPVPTEGMVAVIDPREEWPQLFVDAWRLFRDYFYAANLHGVDWVAVRDSYRPWIDACASRHDVDYVIREMIAELNCGHAYLNGGDLERGPRVGVGLLGCDFELDGGAYRIARILRGGVWDSDAVSPLGRPGLDVAEGDYLLAVDGVAVDPAQDPWAALVGKAGRAVELTVSSSPTLGDDARRVWVRALESEGELRYRHWIETNRATVERLGGGRVGYVYIPDTGEDGRNDFFRQLYGQSHLPALILDERWNGGGQFPNREVDTLDRPLTNYWARRWGRVWPTPSDSHQGPKCMLINRDAGSGGDMLPYLFRQAGLGKLIGTRTWGGLVGYSGSPALIDGARLAIPSFGFYELDGTWGVEGHGVDPDIEVLDDPALMLNGGDPQLEAAVALMLQELEAGGHVPVPPPADPDRSGMGLPESDRNSYPPARRR